MKIKNRSKEIEISDEELDELILKLKKFLKINNYGYYFFDSCSGLCNYKLKLTENQINKFLDFLFKNSKKASLYNITDILKEISFGNKRIKFTKKIIEIFLQAARYTCLNFEDVVHNLFLIVPDLCDNKKIFKLFIDAIKENNVYNLDNLDLTFIRSILNKTELPNFDNNFRFFKNELEVIRVFILDAEVNEKSSIFTNFIKERLKI